ncbi:MAG: dihydrodipicolinate synthase family protein [Cyclobacteriaceae bacterium]
MGLEWKGVYPAITTKFNKDLTIDFDGCQKGVQAQLDAGVDGIILGGTLGEASSLEGNEKAELIKSTQAVTNGKVPVVINIAEQTTKGAIEVAKLAESVEADGLMMLPPMRYKATDRETVAYFKAIAESTDLPIMLYNNPVDYKIMITLDMMEELSACQNITAVKESTRDTTNVIRMTNRFGDRFKVLGGVDTLAFECLALGAHGWVAGLVCAFPKETVAIYRLVKAGRLEEALAIYKWFMPLLELDIDPQLVQNIKLAEQLVGLGTETVRPPRLPLTGARRAEVIKIIETSLDSRPELPDYLQIMV